MKAEYKNKITDELVKFLYSHIPVQVIINPIVALLLVYVFSDIYDSRYLFGWFSVVVLLLSARLLLLFEYKRKKKTRSSTWWGGVYSLHMVAYGLVWGLGGYFMIDFQYPIESLAMLLAITGLTAGSFISHSSYYLAYIAFSVFSVFPIAASLAQSNYQHTTILAVFCLIYVFILWVYARKSHAVLVQSIVANLEKEEIVKQLTVQTEIADRERSKAEKANCDKSMFIASASHDLRQPLHALRIFTDLLKAGGKGEAETIDKISRSTDALENLFNGLLDISRIESGSMDVRKEVFRLDDLLSGLIGEFEALASEKDLALRYVKSSVVVYTDRALLERVVRNLLANAVKYTGSGRIVIGIRRKSGCCRIAVYDTGVGIDGDDIEFIFDEYRQVNNPERNRSKGLGLGLAIAQGISEALGSNLQVASRPGKGSCFCLDIETTDAEPASSVVKEGNAEIVSSGGVSVLIEDDEDARSAMEDLLSAWGYRIFPADDAETAIKDLFEAGCRPDVIVSDYRLAGNSTGVEQIALVRDVYGDVPAVVVSGDLHVVEELSSSGEYIALSKPLKPLRLRMVLEQLGVV